MIIAPVGCKFNYQEMKRNKLERISQEKMFLFCVFNMHPGVMFQEFMDWV